MKKKETLKEAAIYYASNYFEMTNLKNYKALKQGFEAGAKWQQEQISDFLYEEITERRDYSAFKMCEKVIEFIKQFKNK